MDFLEKDMYDPVCNYLKEQGYDVRGEVKGCDIVAYKDDVLLVVELKKAFNLKLVYQAIDRQIFAQRVYVGISRDKLKMRDASYKGMVKLLKKLDVGLLTVAMDSPIKTVQEIVTPLEDIKSQNHRKKKSVKTEFDNRSKDLNKGGSTKTKIITAYKEKAIEMLCILEYTDVITYGELREMGYGPKMQNILSKNFYNWFIKIDKKTYALNEEGVEALEDIKYKELVDYYRDELTNKGVKRL